MGSYKVLSPVSAAAAKLLQSCTTLCDPIDSSPPGSAVPGILQARTLLIPGKYSVMHSIFLGWLPLGNLNFSVPKSGWR